MKNVTCIVGIKDNQELILNEDLAVRFINKNPTHPPQKMNFKDIFTSESFFP